MKKTKQNYDKTQRKKSLIKDTRKYIKKEIILEREELYRVVEEIIENAIVRILMFHSLSLI